MNKEKKEVQNTDNRKRLQDLNKAYTECITT